MEPSRIYVCKQQTEDFPSALQNKYKDFQMHRYPWNGVLIRQYSKVVK